MRRIAAHRVVSELIDGIAVSCVDAAMPMVMIEATALGLSGYETDELGANAALMARLESIRREAGRRMRLGDVADKVVPKLACSPLLARAAR